MELFGLCCIALGGHDVAKSPQAVGLLGAENQLLRKLIAFIRRRLRRVGVEAKQRRCFELEATLLRARDAGSPSQRPARSRRRRELSAVAGARASQPVARP